MKRTLVVEISEAELACRILEAAVGVNRPKNATPEQALSAADDGLDGAGQAAWRMARAAMLYFQECTEAGQPLAS
jgi:hypothetical protein